MVEERDTGLEPYRHARTILNLQKGRQGRLEVEVRHAVDKRREALAGVECVEALVRRVGWINSLSADQSRDPLPAVNQAKVASALFLEEPLPPEILQQRLVFSKGWEAWENALERYGIPFPFRGLQNSPT